MKVAVVGLNSLFACGASSFMLHLVHKSDWDLVIYTECSDEFPKDIPAPVGFKPIIRVGPETIKEALRKYDIILFASPRWGGDYWFLEKLGLIHQKIGIVVHDERDFTRMGMHNLINRFPSSKIFCFDRTVPELFVKYDFNVIKHPYNIIMLSCNSDNRKYDHKFLMCATRVSPSKNINKVLDCAGNYPLRVFGVDSEEEFPFEIRTNVTLHRGVYTFEDISSAYSCAIASLDASKLLTPCKRTQYAFMDAWKFNLPVLCEDEWMGDEMINGVNCLTLNKENVKAVFENNEVAERIGTNGHRTLLSNHNPDCVRKDIVERLMYGRQK